MKYLVDTNVLLRFADRSHPLHPAIRSAIRVLNKEHHQLCVSSQNCIEFWNVATRPANKNGFGLTPTNANQLLRLLERLFLVLPDQPTVYEEWRRLVVQVGVSGVQVHDARLVATMKANQISQILTLNVSDFTRYKSEGIVALSPTALTEDQEKKG